MPLWSDSSISHASSDFLFLEDRHSVGIDHIRRHRRLSFLIWSIAHLCALCVLFAEAGWEGGSTINRF